MLQANGQRDPCYGRRFQLILSRNPDFRLRKHDGNKRLYDLRLNKAHRNFCYLHFCGDVNEMRGVRLRQVNAGFRNRRKNRHGAKQEKNYDSRQSKPPGLVTWGDEVGLWSRFHATTIRYRWLHYLTLTPFANWSLFSGVLKAHRNGVPTNHPLRRAENRAKRAAGKSSECCRTCFGHDLILFAGTATDPDGSYHLAVLLQRNSPGENHNLPVIRCVNAEKLPARL